MISLIMRLINGGLNQPEYGAPIAMYGVPPRDIGKNILQYFLFFLFLVLIPAILIIGVFAFAKKKQFSKKEKFWTIFTVLAVYFTVLIGAVLAIAYIIS